MKNSILDIRLDSEYAPEHLEKVYLGPCQAPTIVKSVRIWSLSGPYFPALGLNTDQKNSEYGHFSGSGFLRNYFPKTAPS